MTVEVSFTDNELLKMNIDKKVFFFVKTNTKTYLKPLE